MVTDLVGGEWAERLPAEVARLVRIPSISPSFDPDWAERGYLVDVVDAAANWLVGELGSAATVQRLQLGDRTPALLCQIAGTEDGAAILVYGHLDVQPAGDGWTVGAAFEPRRSSGRLFGRGAGDDKYVPAMVTCALQSLVVDAATHPPIIVLLETSEESSSCDLPAYLDAEREAIGDLRCIVCLDTFVPANDRLWVTSSLRGIIVADLSVTVAAAGIHSGIGGGIRPSSFRLLRKLLDRIENAESGEVLLPQLRAEPPARARAELAAQAAAVPHLANQLGLLPGVRPMVADAEQQLLRQTWEPTVAYTGVDGMPSIHQAGSVLRPSTTLRLSVRLPPSVTAADAAAAMSRTLQTDPPAHAVVELQIVAAQDGFIAQRSEYWANRLDVASFTAWGKPAAWAAGGATIPFLAMITARYPGVPVLPLGLLDTASNPHGPDESLNLVAAARLTRALASILHDGA